MKEIILFENLNKLDDISNDLVNLCCLCFRVDKARASYNMSKFFEHDNNHCAVGLIDGKVVSFYGVLVSSFAEEKFAISVNTMSDGSMQRSTSILGQSVYENLLDNHNVKTVIGFPNENIIDQRIKYLGWEYITDLHYAFIGYPKIYSDWRKSYHAFENLDINIPDYIRKTTLTGFPLYSPNFIHEAWSILPGIIAFDSRHILPHGSLRIPKISKKLCVKPLLDKSQLYIKIQEGSVFLSHDSIDVP